MLARMGHVHQKLRLCIFAFKNTKTYTVT